MAQAGSGLSRAEHCRRHTHSCHALIYWQRKFLWYDNQGMTLVPVALPHVPARTGDQKDDAGLKILPPGHIAIAVADDFSAPTLARLLNLLGNR